MCNNCEQTRRENEKLGATTGPMCFRCGRTQYWHPDGSCHVFVPKREDTFSSPYAGVRFLGGPFHGQVRTVDKGHPIVRVPVPGVPPVAWLTPDSPPIKSGLRELIYVRYRPAFEGPDYFILKEEPS